MSTSSRKTIDFHYRHEFRKSAYVDKVFGVQRVETPIKRSLSGFECEFMLVDANGDVSNSANPIIKKCRESFKERFVVKEIGLNMLEVRAYPHSNIRKTSLKLVENVEKLQSIVSDAGLKLLPLGSYPGKFSSKIQKTRRYDLLAIALGPARLKRIFPRCTGFHCHYTLPKGTFDRKTRFLKNIKSPKVKQTLIDSYNFLIAADPVLSNIMQSSPFIDGRYHAKDFRMLMWRGGKALKYEGIFHDFPSLGQLPKYEHTLTDMIDKLGSADEKFRRVLTEKKVDKETIARKKKLDFVWNPVKINKLGTIEQRGMDMNHLDICLGVGVMLKFILRAIQQEFYHVLPSDTGISEPFKLDGNAIFIPPQSYVRKELQYQSAYNGFSDSAMHANCAAFFKLAKKLVYKEYSGALKPIGKMIDKKESVSDSILKYAKKKGHSLEEELPQEISRKIALIHANKLSRNIEKTKKRYEALV